MNFFLSTDVIIGINEFNKVCDHLSNMRLLRPVIIYDINLEDSEHFKRNINLIKNYYSDIKIIVNDLNGEPTYQYLELKRNEIISFSPDSIIAVGGGSTMDLGKGLALLLTNDSPALSLKGFPKNINDPLPLVTIPSILGSGSEVSYNAVFIDEAENRKLGINSKNNFPKKTIIDPILSMSAPKNAVVSSAMDSIVHCVDSFGSQKSTPLSLMYSIKGFHSSLKFFIDDNFDDAKSRLSLAYGSICGIVALMNSGDGPTNGFAYYLGVNRRVAHGMAGAVFLIDVMNYNIENGFYDYHKLNPELNFSSTEQKCADLIKKLEKIYDAYKIPTLNHFGYNHRDIEDLAEKCSSSLSGSFAGNPINFDKNSAIKVIKKNLAR